MIWVLVGALAVSISGSFWPKPEGLTMEEHLRQIAPMKNLMLAVPLLGGSMLRLVLGLHDRPHRRPPHRPDRHDADGRAAAARLVVGRLACRKCCWSA